ncbi:extracellular solute-binding protein [Bosea caraganae]|nr:extracellular solute-binding protein [Bosea caraganae]
MLTICPAGSLATRSFVSASLIVIRKELTNVKIMPIAGLVVIATSAAKCRTSTAHQRTTLEAGPNLASNPHRESDILSFAAMRQGLETDFGPTVQDVASNGGRDRQVREATLKNRGTTMAELQTFAEDCREILVERHRRGEISRRGMMLALGAMGLAPAVLRGGPALAAAPDVVMANWGGDALKAMTATFGANYEKNVGGKIVMDGTGPSNGKIRAMVEAKAVTWDICDAGSAAIGELGPLGMLEPIDYSVVDKSKTIPQFIYEFGVCNYLFSFVTAWDTTKIKTTPTPADFFDIKKYPGKRMVRKDAQPMLELALMADGVAPDKLYPLDVKRAFAKIASIKEHLLYWENGTQSQELLRNGEVVMGWLWHTRANLLKRETKGRIDWNFNDGVLVSGLWVVPKGAPQVKQAMIALKSFQDPEPQVGLLAALGNGPSNPAANAITPAELQPINPGAEANLAVQAKMNYDWWMKNYAETLIAYRDMISS